MAKLAIQEKLTNEKQLGLYQEQYESIQKQTQILLEKLEQLKETFYQLQQKKILLASRANVAQSIKQIQKATVSFQTDSIARGIARAEDHILMMEAEVQAGNQFSAPLVQLPIGNQNSISDEEVNSELEKLKGEKVGI